MAKALVILILMTIAVLVYCADSQSKSIPTLKAGESAKGRIYKADRYKSYQLVQVPSLDKKYLFITLTTEEIYDHLTLNLLIYKQGEQKPLQNCTKEQLDSCYLPKSMLKEHETLLIVVESQDSYQLQYHLHSYWSDLEHINVGEQIRFMFSEEEQKQVYHLELEGQEFKELRILIKPETRRYPFDKVKMYGTFGKDSNPSAENYQFQSFPLWEDAQGVYLFRSEIKDLSMNLILYGMTETVYTMKCWVSNTTHSDLPIDSKIYQYLEQSERYLYHLQFKDKEGKYLYENYVFRASIFSGDLEIKFFKDEQKREEIKGFDPFMYMGDIQYLFTMQQITSDMPNGLYIEVSSASRVTTYMMEFEGRTKSQALQLNQHIYEFLPIKTSERAYFKVGQFSHQKSTKIGEYKVTLTQINVQGNTNLQFFICNNITSQCLGNDYSNHTSPLKSEIREVGSKITHTLSLTSDMFNTINKVEQHALILIILSNKVNGNDSFVALEYNVGNRPQFLRENKPIEAHVKKGELKTYKYVCKDPSITKVKVHINTLSGNVQAFSFRKNPSETELTSLNSLIKNGLIQITENLLSDPLVIVISGSDSSTFSIVVEPITNIKDDFSYITLSEDVEFKSQIAPNEFQILQIVPIQSRIYFSYKSTGAVHMCQLNGDGVCDTSSEIPSLQAIGQIKIQNFTGRSTYIRLSNPSSSRIIEVRSIFHSKKQENCDLVKVGELKREIFSQGKCIYADLASPRNYQVMIVHQEVTKINYQMLICDRLINFQRKDNEQQKYLITKQIIETNCARHSQNTFTLYVIGDPSHLQNGRIIDPETLAIKFIIQAENGVTIVPDGVGYEGEGKTTQLPLKKFAFKLLNKIDTSIVVTTRHKLYFLVKVVEGINKDKETISLTDFHFSSPVDKYYFLDSLYLIVPGRQLASKQCTECYLLIYLYSKEHLGQVVSYNIEVSQNFHHLEHGNKQSNFLTQYSKAYYGFTAKQEGTVVVEVSDNNMGCAQIYMSNKEYPDQNNYIQRSFDGQLLYKNSNKSPKIYYITVKARENCAYSIGASLATGNINLFKLERGILSNLNLQEGEVKYYTFRHYSDSPFKILALNKYGRVDFYLSQTTQEQVSQKFTSNTLNYQQFDYKSQHRNRLIIDTHNRHFCKGCLYLLAVVAKKHTQSSLFLGDELTKVPLSEHKSLNDILPQSGNTTKAEFYPVAEGVLEVKVHSGKLEVIIQYKDQYIKEVFEKSAETQTRNISINIITGFYGTATMTITSYISNTVYSLRLKSIESMSSSSDENGVDYTTVNADEATYIFITERQNCLQGFFKGKDERVFASFYLNDRQKLFNLSVSGTFNGEASDITRDLTRNVMSIGFIKSANMEYSKGVPYELCFSIDNQTLSAVVMQTSETSTLPENVEMLVSGKQTYDIYPEGQFILDVFECRGSASIAYGNSKSDLQSTKEKVLDIVGIADQTHAVKIERGYFNMLLRVNSPLALIRWLPINQMEGKGLGYYLYEAGNFKYDSSFGQLNFIVKPVNSTKKKTKTKLVDIKYSLYVSTSEEDLKEASLCEKYLPSSVMEYRTVHEQVNTNQFKFSIDKNALMTKYNQEQELKNLFAIIVADVTLQTPDSSEEYYRFVYNQQEIPADLFKPSKLEQFQLIFIIVFLVVLTLTLFACAFLCTKVFVPMIGRLKNRMLVEEGGLETSKDKDEMKQQNLQPPPSSDRQNINAIQGPPETQDRMD